MATTATSAAAPAGTHAGGGASGSSAEPPPAAALQLLQEFLEVQARRAELYSSFSAGFRGYLASGDELAHARLMQQLTPGFNAASQQVRTDGPLGEAQVLGDLLGAQPLLEAKCYSRPVLVW